MQIIDTGGKTIISAGLNDDSHLIITMSDNTTIDAGLIIALPGINGITPVKGVDYFDGINGTSAPLNLSIRQIGSNGLVTPERFAWPVNITVSQLLLNCQPLLYAFLKKLHLFSYSKYYYCICIFLTCRNGNVVYY